MLRVTIELIPFGNEENKRKIGEMVIANTGDGTGALGDYEAWTAPDSHSNEPLMFGKLKGYDRRQSVWELIRLMLESIRLEKHKPDKEKTSLSQRLKLKLGL